MPLVCGCCGLECTQCAGGVPVNIIVDNVGSYTCVGDCTYTRSGSFLMAYEGLSGACTWAHRETGIVSCGIFTASFLITFQVFQVGANTLYRLSIRLNPPSFSGTSRIIVYEKTETGYPRNCGDDFDAGITLNKVSDTGGTCTGTAPATMFVFAA